MLGIVDSLVQLHDVIGGRVLCAGLQWRHHAGAAGDVVVTGDNQVRQRFHDEEGGAAADLDASVAHHLPSTTPPPRRRRNDRKQAQRTATVLATL